MSWKNEYIHHELTVGACGKALKEWTDSTLKTRCKNCWLRNYDCYCNYLLSRKEEYEQFEGNITIYYHFLEIGRSANTIHIVDSLLPSNTTSFVFGDMEEENKFVKKIIQEQMVGKIQTCILYPCTESIPLSQFIQNNSVSAKAINLVVLDGTYMHAPRQVCTSVAPHHRITLLIDEIFKTLIPKCGR